MSNSRNKLRGIQSVVLGLTLVGLTVFILTIVRIFKFWGLVEIGALVVMVVAWFLVFFGASKISQHGAEFKKVRIMSMVVIVLLLVEAGLLFKNIRAGMEEQSYFDIVIMFIAYLSVLGLIYTYAKMVKGVNQASKKSEKTKHYFSDKVWVIPAVVILLSMILIPTTGMFGRYVEYIGTAVIALCALVAQLYMCNLLMKAKNN